MDELIYNIYNKNDVSPDTYEKEIEVYGYYNNLHKNDNLLFINELINLN